jgi:hypothetical protein
MADIMRRIVAAILPLIVLAMGHAADPPVEPLKVAPRPFEEFKFLPGTIVVVRSDAREGLGKVDAVVLTPDEYRRLLDSIDQLKKQVAPDKPQAPSKCRISGRVELRGQQEVVKLHAVFEFVNTSARMTWFLGFRRAAAVAAALDGNKPPSLQPGSEGYLATVDGQGAHALTLDFELPLQSRGKAGEHGVTINLPGSPISVVEQFELPAGVASARLRPIAIGMSLVLSAPTRTIAAKDLLKPANDWPALALGAVDGIELNWDSPTPQKPAEPLLTADGDIRVQIGDSVIQTTATLLLRSLRGRITEWKLQMPSGAEVALAGPATETGPSVYSMNDDKSRWIVRSDDGGIESLSVTVTVRQSRQPGKPAAIGPFNLEGAFRQQGLIRILAPNNLRAKPSRMRNDIGQRELPADAGFSDSRAESIQAVYGYGQIAPTSPSAPLMFLDSEVIRGSLRTQVSHQLTLTEGGWRLVTDIVATPIRTDLEVIDLEIPSVLQPSVEIGPKELVERFNRVDAASNRWQVRLARPRQGETTLQLEAIYPRIEPAPADAESTVRESASLALPRVLQSNDRDGQITVAVPDGYQLRGVLHEWDRDRIGTWTKALEERSGKPAKIGLTAVKPAMVDLSWVPLSAVVPIKTTIDMELEDRQATVRERITLPASAEARQIVMRSIGPAPNRLQVTAGGTLVARGNGEWLLALAASADREASAVIAYSWARSESDDRPGSRQETCLLWPITAADCDVIVRIWAGGNRRPVLVGGGWDLLPADSVPDHESLPALVLHGGGSPTPLTLALDEAVGLAPASIVAERALIQVVSGEGGQRRYLARFAIRSVAASFLDVELPANVASIANLELFLNGKRLDQVVVVDGAGAPAAPTVGRIVRIPLAGLNSNSELAVSFILSDVSSGAFASRWDTDLTPPRLRGPVFVGAIRWQVMLPAGSIAIPGDRWLDLDQHWGLYKGLPTPIPVQSSAQLEEWLRFGIDNSPGGESPMAGSDAGAIVRQARLGPIRLIVIPRMVWYLASSLMALAMGGTLVLARRRRWVLWTTSTALLAGWAALALTWPQMTLIFAAGMPPGLLVLALMVFFAAWQARRYRRRVVFMPGFTRSRQSSSVTGGGSSHRQLQPSTIDGPAPG